jgi:hypothetical protein
LRSQGRVSDDSKEVYNTIMKRFIKLLMEKISHGVKKFESNVQMLAFYIGFGIIGSDE